METENNVATVTELSDGSLATPDGRIYRRTEERVRRRNGTALVEAACAIVTDAYPDGLVLYDGADALKQWVKIVPRLAVGRTGRVVDLQWMGHVWRTDDGMSLLRLEGRH